ncbi:MAG: response regulator [Geminicoccaceae bacterium]
MNILLVEDDEIDALVVRRAFSELGVPFDLVNAHDGVDALERLRGSDGHPPVPRPRLVLLDLNMPRMTGIEFLSELRADESLRSTLVFVLTTSSDQRDILKAYDHNVAGYIVKPDTPAEVADTMTMIKAYCERVAFP